MIEDREIRDRAAALGVPARQLVRDHLLSHLIHSLQDVQDGVFIGGTALHRTHLPDVRLSEDLDLHLLDGDPNAIVQNLLRAARLEFPGLSADRVRGPVFTSYLNDDRVRVRIQIVERRSEWAALPAHPTPVRLYYSDLPASVELIVPTPASFGALKLAAYVDRKSPRDLFDLRHLAEHDWLESEALELTGHLLRRKPFPQEFAKPPSPEVWSTELAHQIAVPGTPEESLHVVFETLAAQLGWEQ